MYCVRMKQFPYASQLFISVTGRTKLSQSLRNTHEHSFISWKMCKCVQSNVLFFNIRKGFLIIRYWFLNYNSRNTDKCCELSMLTCDVSTSRINSIILYGVFFLEIENCEMQGSHSLIVTSLIKFLTMGWCKCFCQTGSLCLLFGDWLHIKTHGR